MRRRIFLLLFCGPILISLVGSSCHSNDYNKRSEHGHPGHKQPVGRSVDNFALLDQEGKFHELFYYSDMKAVVLIAQGNGCPIVRKSIPYLRELKEKYQPLGVIFLMINANPQDDRFAIAREAREYNINIPILEDKSQVVTESLNFIRTAEAVVINPVDWTIVYQGSIHDRLDYETQETEIKSHYLREALDAHLKGQLIPVSRTSVKGCLVNLEHHSRRYTYTEDVAPILKKNCLQCHSPMGIAPWSMEDYKTVKGWGPMIREVVRVKRMPPWHADPYYGKFKDDMSLTSEEVSALIHWVEQGCPRGQGEDILAKTSESQLHEWPLGQPDLTFTLKEEQHIPTGGLDEFRTVESDKSVEKDIWIRAIDIRPSNFNVVHHCNVIVEGPHPKDWNRANEENAEDLKTMENWYRHSGAASDAGQIIAGYSPGGNLFVLPEDVGMFVPKGSRLNFRMHYVPTGKPEKDLTRMGLYLYKHQPSHVLSFEIINNRSIQIPPGTKEYKITASYQLPKDIVLMTLQPHMHLRGKSMKFMVEYPNGTSETLLSVPHYKFRWQRLYVLKEPKQLSAGTRITIEGTYDNSKQNPDNPDPSKEVTYGPKSDAEMLSGIFSYIVEK